MITVSNISKKFKIFKSPRDRVKESLSITRKQYHKEFWALRNVSFNVPEGCTMGIMGVNGSGKSTLLKIICGYLEATSGSVMSRGRIASILELGTGFSRDFTGKENVILYGGLMGLSRKRILEKLPMVEAFADIGEFFERPLRIYSSGMFTRLAFACTVHMEPKILIIDEALAVGDIDFQLKCMDRIKKLQNEGTTILLVSHSIGAVKSLCREAILLNNGKKVKEGSAEEVANYYHGLLAKREQEKIKKEADRKKKVVSLPKADPVAEPKAEPKAETKADPKAEPPAANDVGTGEVRIEQVSIKDLKGNFLKSVEFNQEVCISSTFRALAPCRPAVFGCLVRDSYGLDLLGTNTAVEGLTLPKLEAGETCTINYRLRLPLLNGRYSITVAVGHDPAKPIFYDWQDNICVFEMLPPVERKVVGCKVHLPIEIEINKEQASDSDASEFDEGDGLFPGQISQGI